MQRAKDDVRHNDVSVDGVCHNDCRGMFLAFKFRGIPTDNEEVRFALLRPLLLKSLLVCPLLPEVFGEWTGFLQHQEASECYHPTWIPFVVISNIPARAEMHAFDHRCRGRHT